MGFTAINTTRAGGDTASTASGERGNQDAASPATIASEYLGRGQAEATAAPVAATSKKVGTKGKKRAATTTGTTQKKRRKSSNVDDGLQVIKARPPNEPNESTNPSKPLATVITTGSMPKKKLSAVTKKRKDDSQYVGGDLAEDLPSKAKPVSLCAQTTSMDTLDSTSARTSIDSVKANAGQSITVYQDPSSSISHQSNVEHSQPLLHDATNVQANAKRNQNPIGSKTDRIQAATTDAAVDAASTAMRRSARAKPSVNYVDQDGFITIEDTESSDDGLAQRRSTTTRRRTRSSEKIGADDGFGEIDDDDILESAMTIDDAIVNRPATPPPRGRKQNMRDVDEHEDYGGALLTTDDLKLLAQIKTKHTSKEPTTKPIVRNPVPPPIFDRSPLFGASNTTLLRTCFRVGEALNTGSQAVRANENVIIELYARITSSWRDTPPGRKQHFVFKDLYHDKPPYLEGVFELWDQAQLWDLDSKPFLKAEEKSGMMCRAIARMRREGMKWKLEVLSVWEANWEDVDFVAGVCNGDVTKDGDEE